MSEEFWEAVKKGRVESEKGFLSYRKADDSIVAHPKSGPSIQNPMNHELKMEPGRNHFFEASQEAKMNKRSQILNTAASLTSGDRNKAYGEPIDNMEIFAALVDAYLNNKSNTLTIDEVDASIIMVLSKIARVGMNRGHGDNYVDGAAYMAIAGEIDQIKKERGDYES